MAADTRTEIEQALAEADIQMDAGRFVGVVRDALRSVRHRRVEAEPSTQLTKGEVAELRAGGLASEADLRAYGRVRARTAADITALLATALTTTEAAKRLGVDPSRVRQLLGSGQLLAAKEAGEWRVLELQFADDRLVPNISQVVRALPPGLPLLAAANWLTTPEPDLELEGEPASPLRWLAAGGDVERLRRVVADL
jgi:hypothetical protein